MSAYIAALREGGWLDEITDKAQWDNLARSFEAQLQLVLEFGDIVYPVGCEVVVLDESATVALEDFAHPENAIYVFGRSTFNNIQDLVPHDHQVKVVTPQQKGCFGISIAGAVLHSRSLQWP